MARGRMIAKTLSTSQRYARLHDVAGKLAEFCQALYPLLVAHADDWGCLPGDVFTVKHLVHPTSPRRLGDFEGALIALHEVGLIQWYEVDEKRVVYIRQWLAHQQLKGHDKDGRVPIFPPPPENTNDFAIVAQIRPNSPKSALREEKRTEEKRREGKGREDAAPAAAPLASVAESDPNQPNCKLEAFVTLWNQTITAPLPQCRGLSDRRKAHIRARFGERSFGEWLEIFQRVNVTPFLRGENDRGWVASLDWLINSPDNALKVLEGKYDDRPRAEKGKPKWATR